MPPLEDQLRSPHAQKTFAAEQRRRPPEHSLYGGGGFTFKESEPHVRLATRGAAP